MFQGNKSNANSNPPANGNKQQQSTSTPNANTPPPGPSGIVDGMHGVPNGQQPTGQPTQQSQTPANPLDAFTNMFDNKQSQGDKAPSFSLPKDVLETVSRGQNFTQGIDEALMAKALGGDAKSLIEIINASSQNAYRSSMDHMASLSDQFVTSRFEHEGKSFGSKVKEQLTNSELSSNTPGFNHPVVKAQLSSVAKDLSKQHPDASPQEIASMAKKYITELAQAINPQESTSAQSGKAVETDWDNYFG